MEQATHLCDIARYLAGDMVDRSVQTISVRDEGPGTAGHLAKVRNTITGTSGNSIHDASIPRVISRAS